MNIDLTSLQVKLNKNKNKLITISPQTPSEFTGVLGGEELLPLRYNELQSDVVAYDGTDQIRYSSGKFYKNNEQTPFFEVAQNHFKIEMDNTFEDPKTYLEGDKLVVGEKSLSGITPSYDYTLINYNDQIVTLMPKTPTNLDDVLSYEVDDDTGIVPTTTYYAIYEKDTKKRYSIDDLKKFISENQNDIELIDKWKISGDRYHFQISGRYKKSEKFRTNYCFYGKWLEAKSSGYTKGMLLATNSDGVYEGGWKIDKGDYSVLYYNNTIVGLSYNHKTLVQGIDDIEFSSSGVPYVKYNDNWYKITIENGAEFQIIDDRYIVANTTTYKNTYDLKTGKSFCRNDDYNGRLLVVAKDVEIEEEYVPATVEINSWTVYRADNPYLSKHEFTLHDVEYTALNKGSATGSQAGISYSCQLTLFGETFDFQTGNITKEYKKEVDGKQYNISIHYPTINEISVTPTIKIEEIYEKDYDFVDLSASFVSKYMATAINVNNITSVNPVQGTIWPQFNVSMNPATDDYTYLDYWQDSSRVIIEIYEDSLFKFSLGGNVNGIGKTYPDSTNTLYSVAELDTFVSTKNGYWLVKTPFFSALSALSNVQTSTFSYYIGTMNELDNSFVIQGTMYGITKSKMIVSMEVSSNTISGTNLITYCGDLQYLGQTQQSAYFFDNTDLNIYEFTSNLTLNKVFECTLGKPKLVVNEPERNKIAMVIDSSSIPNDNGTYVIEDNNIYHIPFTADSLQFSNGWLLIGNKAFSKFEGEKTLPITYESGPISAGLENTISIEEVDVLLDIDDAGAPPYLTYKISIDEEEGEEREITPDNTLIKLTPTTTRTEGLYFNVILETNCNIRAAAIQTSQKAKSVLTKNNG